VAEAQRFAKMELKDLGSAADDFDDSANFVGARDRVKGGGNKRKKFKKGK
jgi:hypothetical protein